MLKNSEYYHIVLKIFVSVREVRLSPPSFSRIPLQREQLPLRLDRGAVLAVHPRQLDRHASGHRHVCLLR